MSPITNDVSHAIYNGTLACLAACPMEEREPLIHLMEAHRRENDKQQQIHPMFELNGSFLLVAMRVASLLYGERSLSHTTCAGENPS